jgi:cell division protein FtsX
LNVSSEYQNLVDALNTNGAVVSMDNNENSVITISGNTLDQTTVLSNTKETLEKEKEEVNELTNNYQYIKKLEPPKNEAARVSPTFLIVVAIMEVILIGFYLVMMFN